MDTEPHEPADSPLRYMGTDAVVDAVAGPARLRADRLQALPERVLEPSTAVVEGERPWGPSTAGSSVPFVHAFELEDGVIRACRASTDTALERAVFDA